MFTESRSTKNPDFALERREMSVSVQACKVKVDTGSQTWTRPIQASTQYHPVGNAYELPPPPPESKRERQASRQKLVNGKKGAVEEDTSLMTEEQLNERKKAAERDRSYAHLARFLAKTFGLMENALEQNETVDVFGDLFKGTGARAASSLNLTPSTRVVSKNLSRFGPRRGRRSVPERTRSRRWRLRDRAAATPSS